MILPKVHLEKLKHEFLKSDFKSKQEKQKHWRKIILSIKFNFFMFSSSWPLESQDWFNIFSRFVTV